MEIQQRWSLEVSIKKERGGEELGRRLVGVGRGDDEFEAEVLGGPEPRARHVGIAVADKGDLLALPGAEFFADCEEVGEDLARVLVVGEGVDGRDAGEL